MNRLLVALLAHTSCVLFFAGCTRPDRPEEPNQVSTEDFIMTETLKSVNEEFKKLDDKDKDLIVKQFTGAYFFLENNSVMKSSSDFDPILSRVQSDFGWDREKYPEFTTAVSKYLVEQGYDDPRQLTGSDRVWFANIFKNLSKAVRYE